MCDAEGDEFDSSCFTAGYLLCEGSLVQGDLKKGLEYLKKACAKREASGCILAATYSIGWHPVEWESRTAEEMSEALMWLMKGCQLEVSSRDTYTQACWMATQVQRFMRESR